MFTNQSSQASLNVWRLLDGKPGHEHQTLGLVNAIKQRATVRCFDIAISKQQQAIYTWLTSKWSGGESLNKPDLIIGAGHRTHLHMLAAQRVYGGKTVCLMQPSLPVTWFDVCLIPEHDQYHGAGNFIETRGVLNHIQANSSLRESNRVLVMIGGPSKHYQWDTGLVVAQVYALVHRAPDKTFVLTTSRRTPFDFIKALQRIRFPNLEIIPFEQTDQGWVARELNLASHAWVTEDSVSMVYEGLTANVAVGLINLDRERESRVTRGIQTLVNKGLVRRFDLDAHDQTQFNVATGFNEARRCTDLMLKHLFQPESGRESKFVYRLA